MSNPSDFTFTDHVLRMVSALSKIEHLISAKAALETIIQNVEYETPSEQHKFLVAATALRSRILHRASDLASVPVVRESDLKKVIERMVRLETEIRQARVCISGIISDLKNQLQQHNDELIEAGMSDAVESDWESDSEN